MSTLGSIFVLLGLVAHMGYCQIDSATQTSAHQALKLDHTRWWACLIDRWRTAGRYESRIGITTANIVNQQNQGAICQTAAPTQERKSSWESFTGSESQEDI